MEDVLSTISKFQHYIAYPKKSNCPTSIILAMDTVNLPSSSFFSLHHNIQLSNYHARQPKTTITFASKPGANTRQVISMGSCKTCKGKGAVECPGCKGTGRNKKNGNIFERWKCFECQGFGMKSCPSCGKEGLTPEQRGER